MHYNLSVENESYRESPDCTYGSTSTVRRKSGRRQLGGENKRSQANPPLSCYYCWFSAPLLLLPLFYDE